jgi:hypothetical protein
LKISSRSLTSRSTHFCIIFAYEGLLWGHSRKKWCITFKSYNLSVSAWLLYVHLWFNQLIKWHWDRRSLFVEHPQQHILKLRKHILRYFLLIQFFTALQISVAETQEYFPISNPTHSLWTVSRLVNCCNSWKNTTGLDLSDRHCPLTLVWSNEVLNFVSELWPQLLRHWYFILLKHFFLRSLRDSLSSRQNKLGHF